MRDSDYGSFTSERIRHRWFEIDSDVPSEGFFFNVKAMATVIKSEYPSTCLAKQEMAC